jgi:hypothetical protein
MKKNSSALCSQGIKEGDGVVGRRGLELGFCALLQTQHQSSKEREKKKESWKAAFHRRL